MGFHSIDLLLILAPFLLWLWMLIDCAIRKFPTDTSKLIWLLIIFFTYIVGAVVYFLAIWLPRVREQV